MGRDEELLFWGEEGVDDEGMVEEADDGEIDDEEGVGWRKIGLTC